MRIDEDRRNYLLLLILLLIVLFGIVYSPKLHGDAIPLKNPTTGEEGYWISEEDLQASVVAADLAKALKVEVEEMEEKVFKSRRREAIEIGGLVGLLTYIILHLIGGS